MSDDRSAINELFRNSPVGAVHTILHYLYLPTKKVAKMVAAELRSQGFEAEHRLGADGVNWLVLARQRATPTKDLIAATRRSMDALAVQAGGEYDGWEAEVANRK